MEAAAVQGHSGTQASAPQRERTEVSEDRKHRKTTSTSSSEWKKEKEESEGQDLKKPRHVDKNSERPKEVE